MTSDVSSLRERLKQQPGDWDVRLTLADALTQEGAGRQAAVVVSTAPKEPVEGDHLARAARHLLALDAALALRYANAALAADEGNAVAALTCAEAHRAKGDAGSAHRFYVVAAALDPAVVAGANELRSWLAQHDLDAPLPMAPAATEQPRAKEKDHGTRLISSPASGPLKAPPAAVAEVEPEPAEAESAAVAPVVARPMVQIASLQPPAELMEEPAEDAPVLAVVPEAELDSEAEEEIATAVVRDKEPVAALDSAAPIAQPAEKRMLAQKLSAAAVAVMVHAALLLLLGVLVIVGPSPKVAELVGIVSPEAVQDQPETKQVVPSALPSPSVVSASTSRAISATGVSSVTLPAFDAKGTLDALPEIATTDLGASFALPFSPKGTSNVNFFGIKSKGRRVAFLIDAERYMLTDPRGGYPAYQIVKEEIASMIGKLGLETMFNVILYEGRGVSAFSERLLPATAANKAKVSDWLYPVNRQFEKLGIRAINYPVHELRTEVEPVKNDYITGYLRAIQYALECDVDAVFVVCSGYRSMETPRTKEEIEKILKDMRWTEKDDIAWAEAVKKGQDWLAKENAARKAKGVPERVIVNIGEVWRDMNLRPWPRSRPGGIQITAEEREEQIKNAVRIHYLSTGKPKPQINFVIFIGKDQDEDSVPQLAHFENIAQRARNGKVRVLQGMAALKNVTGR